MQNRGNVEINRSNDIRINVAEELIEGTLNNLKKVTINNKTIPVSVKRSNFGNIEFVNLRKQGIPVQQQALQFPKHENSGNINKKNKVYLEYVYKLEQEPDILKKEQEQELVNSPK